MTVKENGRFLKHEVENMGALTRAYRTQHNMTAQIDLARKVLEIITEARFPYRPKAPYDKKLNALRQMIQQIESGKSRSARELQWAVLEAIEYNHSAQRLLISLDTKHIGRPHLRDGEVFRTVTTEGGESVYDSG
jgi:hypothetical protein